MSFFGVIGIDVWKVLFDVLIVVFGKCLEGVFGMGFVFVCSVVLEVSVGNCYFLVMDLQDQYVYMCKIGQWCFILLIYVVVVLYEVFSQYEEEGGLLVCQWCYVSNCEMLFGEMVWFGFCSFLLVEIQVLIIVIFYVLCDLCYCFVDFY